MCRPTKLLEGKYFHQNSNIFLHRAFTYPLAHTLPFFAHAFTHNSRRYLFWKNNNWYYCFMKEKERRVLFLEEKKLTSLLDGRKIQYVHVTRTSPLVWIKNKRKIFGINLFFNLKEFPRRNGGSNKESREMELWKVTPCQQLAKRCSWIFHLRKEALTKPI